MKLIQGDCLDVMKGMEDKSIDIAFTSPPYNRKRNDKYENYIDVVDDWYGWQITVIEELMRITKKYLIYNIQATYYNRKDVYKIIGHFNEEIRDIFIWEKKNPMPASGLAITNAVEYFIFIGDENVRGNNTYTKNIISSAVNSEMPKEHKAVMKQEICDYFISNFSKENDVIFDCFMGTGTTGVACKKIGRDFIGVEINEKYFNMAKQRIEATAEEIQLFEEGK